MLRITVGGLVFSARLEADAAPLTVAGIRKLLPLRSKIIQARWSGEAAWVPLGDLDLGVAVEHQTSTPQPGQLLLYPGRVSETEILFPYGQTRFGSVHGPLEGNHFATLVGEPPLAELGRLVLWDGAQDVTFEETA
jgi:hypothetical protein